MRRSRPRVTAEAREAKRIVRARSGGWCELGIPGVCEGRATNFSHRVGAAHGGPYSAVNGLDACGSGTTGCHGWATHNRTVARERGWILFSTDDPAASPVVHAWLGRVLLLADGTASRVEEAA